MKTTGFNIENKPSSNVQLFGFNIEERRMFFQFKTGTYVCLDVPEETINEARKAESIGKFFAKNIKGKFESVKYDKPFLEEVESDKDGSTCDCPKDQIDL